MIRVAEERDVPEMLAIYAPYILTTTATFEYDVPSREEFLRRLQRGGGGLHQGVYAAFVVQAVDPLQPLPFRRAEGGEVPRKGEDGIAVAVAPEVVRFLVKYLLAAFLNSQAPAAVIGGAGLLRRQRPGDRRLFPGL